MERFTYWWKIPAAILGGAFFLGIIALIVIGVGDFRTTPIPLKLLLIILCLFFYLAIWNYYPDLSIDNEHIYLYGSIIKRQYAFDQIDLIRVLDLSRTGAPILICRIRGSMMLSLSPIVLFGVFFVHSSISGYERIRELIK